MSNWFIPEGSAFEPDDEGPVTVVAIADVALGDNPPLALDALSAPSAEDLQPSALALLPRGPAWRSPDGAAPDTGSRMARLWLGLMAPLADLYASAYALTLESTACTLIDSLEDWEIEYGLPDPCLGEDPSIAARIRNLRLRIQAKAVIMPDDYIRLAASVGYEIVIEEPTMFEMAVSSMGWGTADEIGAAINEFYWIVRMFDVPEDHFLMAENHMGWDRLYDLARAEDLECLFRRLKPGWTEVIFNYEGL